MTVTVRYEPISEIVVNSQLKWDRLYRLAYFSAYPAHYIDHMGKGGKGKILPDGYFSVIQERAGDRLRGRFLLEVNLGTESNLRFVRMKVLQGLAYLKSQEYKARLGANTGGWLVVTTTDQHLKTLKATIEQSAGRLPRPTFS